MARRPDGKLLATADTNGYLRLWDLATRRAVGARVLASTSPGGSVIGVAFSPDGTLLATAGHGRVRTAVGSGHQAGRRRSPPG